jgi:hypothetical protein
MFPMRESVSESIHVKDDDTPTEVKVPSERDTEPNTRCANVCPLKSPVSSPVVSRVVNS